MINIKDLTFSYDDIILDNINIDIKSKKITMIIGQNGIGKSTLSLLLTGLIYPKKGKILIDDYEVTKKSKTKELRERIGIVFQNPNNQILFNTVYDNLKFILDNMNIKDNQDKYIKESLSKVGMDTYININPYNLSMGEKQRVAIACALILKSKYLVFDEPTAMLDINGKENIYKLIQKLKKEGLGIIYVTNILDELIYADDIIIIDNKKVYKYTKEYLLNNLNILKEHNLDIPFKLKVIDKLKISSFNEEDILKNI